MAWFDLLDDKDLMTTGYLLEGKWVKKLKKMCNSNGERSTECCDTYDERVKPKDDDSMTWRTKGPKRSARLLWRGTKKTFVIQRSWLAFSPYCTVRSWKRGSYLANCWKECTVASSLEDGMERWSGSILLGPIRPKSSHVGKQDHNGI